MRVRFQSFQKSSHAVGASVLEDVIERFEPFLVLDILDFGRRRRAIGLDAIGVAAIGGAAVCGLPIGGLVGTVKRGTVNCGGVGGGLHRVLRVPYILPSERKARGYKARLTVLK